MFNRWAGLAVIAIAAPAPAATPDAGDILLVAAYNTPDKATALARIDRALKTAEAALARNPRDMDARLYRALAISYRGKLAKSRTDLMASRKEFEAIVAAHPQNAEAQLALAGWHLAAINAVGPMMARSMLGARKSVGLKALDRALALGGNRALFPAFAGLTRIQLEPGEVAVAKRFAEAALKAGTPTPIDKVMQRNAATMLKTLGANGGQAAAKEARLLAPFGRVR